jgi:regulator of sigma E protease
MESVLISVATFVVVLSIVVFVHELGHYQVARWCGVKVDSFSIGFGPELIGWTNKHNERWKICALPLGGYVMFAGDTNAASSPQGTSTRSGVNKATGFLNDQSVWVRMAVTAAGPVFNFIFAIGVFALLFSILGHQYQRPIVGTLLPNGAAMAGGLQVGDEIVSIDGAAMQSSDDVRQMIAVSGAKLVTITIKRNDETLNLPVTPQVADRETPFGDMEKQGLLGITFSPDPSTIVEERYNPIEAVGRGIQRTGQIIDMQVDFIAALLRGGVSPGHMSGPLGIGQISGKIAQNSADSVGPDASAGKVAQAVVLGLVQLAAVLSIAIGFMNLMPLPMLDGGHLMFYVYEAVRGKPLPDVVRENSMKVGVACLLMLFVFVTFQDIDRLGLFRMLEGVTRAG